MTENKKKGDLLEGLVALLHRVEGVEVETKAKVPVLGGGSETREIDVLLKGSIAGYPLRMAIECKNWGESVGIEIVDAFVGKLIQVGIPPPLGIIVSTQGFTVPAKNRAQEAQIRLLEFEGLTPDRLNRLVYEAFQSIIYVTLTWKAMSLLPIMPRGGPLLPGAFHIIFKRGVGEGIEHWALRAIWAEWKTGGIPLSLGEHVAVVREPEQEGSASDEVIVDLLVNGHVFTVTGELRLSKLKNALTNQLEKLHLDVQFPQGLVSTIRLTTEEALLAHTNRGMLHIVGARVRVPRLELHGAWFPPSVRALQKFDELRKAGEEPSFAKIEGLDIRRAWDEPAVPDGLPPPH